MGFGPVRCNWDWGKKFCCIGLAWALVLGIFPLTASASSDLTEESTPSVCASEESPADTDVIPPHASPKELDPEDPQNPFLQESIPPETEEDVIDIPDPTESETIPEPTEVPAASARTVPLYFQTDYPNHRYGNGTIESSGCGITSLAMVATYLTGHEYLPDELADYFGGRAENNIQRLEIGSDTLQLPWHKAENIHEAMAALEDGDVVIALMGPSSLFTQSQHFIVLTGLNEQGKIMVNDPYAPNYSLWNLENAFVNGFDQGDIFLGYQGAWIYDVSEMPAEPFIYTEEKPYVEPRYPDIELTWEEQQLLAKVIWVEARGESAEGQQAVAEVIFNRMVSDDFPDTLSGVIYADEQFRSSKFLEDAEPAQAQYDALDDALEGPYILPIDVVHFATYPVNDDVWGTIGGHIFCYGYSDAS